ncbi:RNA recognition motif domain [Lasallia pustulata]|uniref:U4/U6 snRNA-associated-splicing factor PRP24 n=1 Tax=Lasallia pustulata TaxID=136370 RepID=A0A1W5DE74_9LECA|nr:RNA recognition motif domain [Lasallia pustulata]
MDINSLLSPQDSPVRDAAPSRSPPAKVPAGPARPARKPRRTKSSTLAQPVTSSPLSSTTLPPPTLPHSAIVQAQQSVPSPTNISPHSTTISPHSTGISPHSAVLSSATSTSSTDTNRPSSRPPSTPGMDTLADLASMQHHQQIARANAGGLRSAEVYDTQLSPSTILPSLHTIPRPTASARSSYELTMTDAPAQTPPRRTFTATSLSEKDLETIARLVEYLAENPYTYESHVKLVNLLHQGLVSHVYPAPSRIAQGDPYSYDLLEDLRKAREAMDSRFAIGEDMWVDWLEDQQLLARTLDDRIAVMESCQRAVEEESGSTRLWKLYGDWMLFLYRSAHEPQQDTADPSKADSQPQGWSEEDKLVGREVFGWQSIMEVWKQGMVETKWRIDDSHVIWDSYTELLMQDFTNPTSDAIATMKAHFMDRLQTPHATWDNTFQAFSTFISNNENFAYEETMVAANQRGADAKRRYGMREVLEVALHRASEAGDKDREWNAYADYIDWELSQSRRKGQFSFELTNTLYQRAILRFPTGTSLWEDYVIFLTDEIGRHNHHGSLWSQHLLAAEQEDRSFEDIGHIKHKATSTGLLDAGGMEEVLKVLTSWCGYLRRQAFQKDSTDDELDVAEVGIRSAIEDMEELGRKKYGEEYRGDPLYRLERIYIKYFSQSGSWDSARGVWRGLIPRRGDSYEFWLRYYGWEMMTWGRLMQDGLDGVSASERRATTPKQATAVLRQALKRTNMDWPEKIMETFIHHCEDHEDVEELQLAVVQVKKATKIVTKRREKEALQSADASAPQQQQSTELQLDANADDTSATVGKRKREEEIDTNSDTNTKRLKPELAYGEADRAEDHSTPASSLVKRDRENATVIVRHLPPETTETRVRQYFRDCGTINSLKLLREEDGLSVSATIEFDSAEDILAAQTKDMKTFDGQSIEVQVGGGSTLFVTNFPPTADETYIREMFQKYGDIVDIRFPSLKYNTHRRFCYLQFKSSNQAQAATQLDGQLLGGKLKLVAKISDPVHKQDRTGALYDGREVYVSNVDWNATEEEITQIFAKYGKVERVRIPANVAGKSKGIAFVVFSTKDEANAALDMNLTKFKTRLLKVELSTANPSKRQATTVIASASRSTASPSPDISYRNGNSNEEIAASAHRASVVTDVKTTAEEIQSRTIALLNIPDTVNDARIHAIVEPYGPLVKVVLRPDHQGAIIEFKDVKDAGKAALGLDGLEIASGRKIGVGSVREMLKQKAEWKTDRIGVASKKDKSGNATTLPPTAPVHRPNQLGARRGGRGGLGFKRGGVGLSGSKGTQDGAGALAGDGRLSGDVNDAGISGGQEPKAKSNADFKAMFLKQ